MVGNTAFRPHRSRGTVPGFRYSEDTVGSRTRIALAPKTAKQLLTSASCVSVPADRPAFSTPSPSAEPMTDDDYSRVVMGTHTLHTLFPESMAYMENQTVPYTRARVTRRWLGSVCSVCG